MSYAGRNAGLKTLARQRWERDQAAQEAARQARNAGAVSRIASLYEATRSQETLTFVTTPECGE